MSRFNLDSSQKQNEKLAQPPTKEAVTLSLSTKLTWCYGRIICISFEHLTCHRFVRITMLGSIVLNEITTLEFEVVIIVIGLIGNLIHSRFHTARLPYD